jgi:hypothetical protein
MLPERDLFQHLALRREHGDAAGYGRADEEAAIRGEGHAVGHVTVAQLGERRRLAVVQTADAVRHRLCPVQPPLGVERDAVGIDAGPLHQKLAVP